MSIWKDQGSTKTPPNQPAEPARPVAEVPATPQRDNSTRGTERSAKESLIAADLAIEGSIEGAGHVRIAGRFTGDVNVKGNLTIELGAKVTGSVRAGVVIIAGELEGNIEGATRVELLETGVLSGDLKAGSLTVAAGSRMRGKVEFGWNDQPAERSARAMESTAAA